MCDVKIVAGKPCQRTTLRFGLYAQDVPLVRIVLALHMLRGTLCFVAIAFVGGLCGAWICLCAFATG